MAQQPQFVNYRDFMTKGLPPHDSLLYPKALGNRMWSVLHGFADHYGCETCKPAFKTLVSGIHDVVSITKLKREPYDEKEFEKFVDLVNEAASEVASRHGGKVPVETDSEGREFVGDDAFKRVLPVTPENVLKAIDHYLGEYNSAASSSDIQFLLSIPHGSPTDKAIDKVLVKAPPERVKHALQELQAQGLVEQDEHGGFVPTEKGRENLFSSAKDFNTKKGRNEAKMLDGSDIGIIIGSQLAARGTEAVSDWYDSTNKLTTQPLHLQSGTYLPIVGAILVGLGWKAKSFKKGSKGLAAVSYGAHLLSTGVDLAQAATQPGVTFGLVAVPRTSLPPASWQPGLTPAAIATPGYLPDQLGGVGGFRSIF